MSRAAKRIWSGASRHTPVMLTRVLPAGVLALLLAVSVGACGVSASSNAKKVGDAYAPGSVPNVARSPARPTAIGPADFVMDYLSAAAGGGDAAAATVTSFLSPAGYKAWQKPDRKSTTIQIIRVLGAPNPQVEGRNGVLEVDFTYVVVGLLTDDGRVVVSPDSASEPVHGQLGLIHPADGSSVWRIDSGVLPGLVLSDQALTQYYLPQPIYFWDATNHWLVPDLRYVPLTVTPDLRAKGIIYGLLHGPSGLLSEAVNTIPVNTSLTGLQSQDQTLVIKLSPQAGGSGSPDDLNRLALQLQASLIPATSNRDLQIWVGNSQVQLPDPTNYYNYELATGLPVSTQKYDIDKGVVKPIGREDQDVATPVPPMLTTPDNAPENSKVLYAAINRNHDLAALVRNIGSHPSLVIISDNAKPAVARKLTASDAVSRPAWIPATDGLLVAWGGQLWVVDRAGLASRVPTPGLSDITEVSVSPDGRRVALVAGGQVTVSLLTVNSTASPVSVRLDGQPQSIMVDPDLITTGVAWQSEWQIYLVGHRTSGDVALWLVSCDGAVANDESSSLRGVAATDVVAYPTGPLAQGGAQAVLLDDPRGPYRVTSPVIPDGTNNPFFVN